MQETRGVWELNCLKSSFPGNWFTLKLSYFVPPFSWNCSYVKIELSRNWASGPWCVWNLFCVEIELSGTSVSWKFNNVEPEFSGNWERCVWVTLKSDVCRMWVALILDYLEIEVFFLLRFVSLRIWLRECHLENLEFLEGEVSRISFFVEIAW